MKPHPNKRREDLQTQEEDRAEAPQPGAKKWRKQRREQQSLQEGDEEVEGVTTHVVTDRPHASIVLRHCALLLGVCLFLVIGSLAVATSLSTSQLSTIVFMGMQMRQGSSTALARDSHQEFHSPTRPSTHLNAGGAFLTSESQSKIAHSRAPASPPQQPGRQKQLGRQKQQLGRQQLGRQKQQFGPHAQLPGRDKEPFMNQAEAFRSDEQYLQRFRESSQVLCNAGPSANGAPVATRYSTPLEPCGRREGEVVVLNGVRMHYRAPKTTLLVPPCKGGEEHGWSTAIDSYTLGGSHLAIEDDVGSPSCDLTIEENTILIHNPRWEFFAGVFHNLEEVFALLQTAEVLGRKPSDFRVLLVYTQVNGSVITLAQPPDQLDTPLAFDTGFMTEKAPRPKELVHHLVDIYSKVAAWTDGDAKKFLKPPLPSNLPRSAQVCFKGEVVLPMRACLGSVLTRTWSSLAQVKRLNNLTMRYAKHIAEDVYHCYVNDTRKKKVLILTRHSKSGRNMRDEDLLALIAGLQSKLPDAEIAAVDFVEISMQEQICLARRTDVMIGVHGSQLTHMIYMPPGSAVLEITPYSVPTYGWSYANYPNNLATWTNHRFAFMRATLSGLHARFDVTEAVRKAVALFRGR